ncbi:hypothetical protein DFH08DRAFT_931118 [Mycena albidolilacea]|uniref:Uncharacterized protein n=1 Tax=Mycena albidolilacea TaxID=1033008 RepID=A0AAD7AJB9_9AGAR|nr:hypothetical protein DFH08DRAFT_931118 [Mycena albidolilacea]
MQARASCRSHGTLSIALGPTASELAGTQNSSLNFPRVIRSWLPQLCIWGLSSIVELVARCVAGNFSARGSSRFSGLLFLVHTSLVQPPWPEPPPPPSS